MVFFLPENRPQLFPSVLHPIEEPEIELRRQNGRSKNGPTRISNLLINEN